MVHVSHNVTAFEFFYEPFYVSLDSAPLYDERFEGYGFTRNTQVFMIQSEDYILRTSLHRGHLNCYVFRRMSFTLLAGSSRCLTLTFCKLFLFIKTLEHHSKKHPLVCKNVSSISYFLGPLTSVHCALGSGKKEGSSNMEGEVDNKKLNRDKNDNKKNKNTPTWRER